MLSSINFNWSILVYLIPFAYVPISIVQTHAVQKKKLSKISEDFPVILFMVR